MNRSHICNKKGINMKILIHSSLTFRDVCSALLGTGVLPMGAEIRPHTSSTQLLLSLSEPDWPTLTHYTGSHEDEVCVCVSS